LFNNAWNAQQNFDHGYNVPVPPVPPDLEVNSKPNRIEVKWTDDNKSPDDDVSPDPAGYRVYRARGNPNPQVIEGRLIGRWKKIFECGQGIGRPIQYSFNDTTALRGENYYYYVTAFDDGAGNISVNGKNLGMLESGKYLARTTQPASLLREPRTSLDGVAIVPNPFHVNATDVQFPGAPNKIVFEELPAECTIQIYSESGDLVKTLQHTDGSGDESWGVNADTYQTTNTGQVVVSGIYIAHISTPDGQSKNIKFIIIR